MKTAVEFLVERLAENGILHSSVIHKAKEMEKEEQQKLGIILAIFAEEIGDKKFTELLIRAEQYYNETFKNK
jgi:hypothetical protein